MKKNSFLLFFAVVISATMHSNNVNDEVLRNILAKKYNCTYLTEKQRDSIFSGIARDAENTNQRYVLDFRDKKSIFRRSFEASFFVKDRNRKDEFALSEDPLRDATLSPNNKYVVYGKRDGNLYIYKLDFRTEVAITRDTFPFINGISDWLYEEEFGTTRLFSFSPDAKYVAFVKLNISEVMDYQWLTYSDSMSYPQLQRLAYPKVKTPNPVANAYVYDIYYKTIRQVKLDGKDDDDYLPRLAWRKVSSQAKEPVYELVVERINRDQNQLFIHSINPKTLTGSIIYKEASDDYYVDYSLFDQNVFMDDGRFLVLSEKEGWNSIYLYSENGLNGQRITPPQMDVTKICGMDEKLGNIYFQAATHPLHRQVFVYNLKQKKTLPLFSNQDGWHDLFLSQDKRYYLHSFESNASPVNYQLYQTSGNKLIRDVFDNKAVQESWMRTQLPNKEFFSFVSPRGDTLYGWLVKPLEMAAGRRYPTVMMQYSGPTSQRVMDKWSKGFAHYLVYKGYVVVCVDGRGTGARGRQWRNASYAHLGEVETEDQLYTAQYLQHFPFVDTERLAICGWSYGGYIALRSLMEQKLFAKQHKLKQPPFICGIAIAPVTDWLYYDSGYTERYMRPWQKNDVGYEQASLMGKAADLTGQLLLVHALADDNVHFQHSAMLIEALNKADKIYDLQVYPNDNHSIKQDKNRLHLHHRIINFLNTHLKNQ